MEPRVGVKSEWEIVSDVQDAEQLQFRSSQILDHRSSTILKRLLDKKKQLQDFHSEKTHLSYWQVTKAERRRNYFSSQVEYFA